MKKIITLFLLIFMCFRVNASVDLAKYSKEAILVEASTGKVLYEKNSNEKRSPASMTKIMTLLLTMEALDSGKIKLDDQVLISKNASSMGGTQIFVEQNTKVPVENLIKGIGIASANDAAVAIAEYIGGTEENFVSMMNERASQLGCKNTTFKNPHGLDEDGHLTTARDLSLIARELIKYPFALKITSTYEDYIDVSGENHWLVNTNKLLRFYTGIDGLKTGYTDKAGYCLTATMERNNMRLLSIVMGADTKDNRSTDTISMMEYGYSSYGTNTILNKNKYSDTIKINNAKKRKVKYYLNDDVKLVVKKGIKDVNYKIDKKLYNVKAPLKKNSKVGKLIVTYENKKYEYDLIVRENVKKSTYLNTVKNNLKDVITGSLTK